MTSFVVVSTDKNSRTAYIDQYCLEFNIDKFDTTLIGKNTSGKNITSIGIDDIKHIHKYIFLKPLKSNIKAVIFDDAQLLTIQAQNALLKILEEPPAHTIIILSVDTVEFLLPTILSRCQIIELAAEKIVLSDGETSEFSQFIESLTNMKIGEKLKKSEELAKDKDLAIDWIAKLILTLREKTLEFYSSSELSESRSNLTIQQFNNLTIKQFQSLYTLLKTTNVNPRMAIENTLLFRKN